MYLVKLKSYKTNRFIFRTNVSYFGANLVIYNIYSMTLRTNPVISSSNQVTFKGNPVISNPGFFALMSCKFGGFEEYNLFS